MAHLSIYLLKRMIFHRKLLNYQRVGSWLFVIGKVQPSDALRMIQGCQFENLGPKEAGRPLFETNHCSRKCSAFEAVSVELIKPSSPHHAIVGRLKSIDMLILYSDATTNRHRCW